MLDRTDDLSVIARIQAGAFGVTEEVMLERLRAGKYPALVRGYLAQRQEQGDRREILVARLRALAAGYSFQQSDDGVLIIGPYCADLSKLLSGHDGYWDGVGGKNRQCFVLPNGSLSLLLRLFERRERHLAKRADLASAACTVSAARREGFLRSA